MIIVSACLAGVECRYNGQGFPVPEVIELVRKGKAIPLCPELLAHLPTPRLSSEQCQGRIVTRNGQDVTAEYTAGARIAVNIAKSAGCDKAILKSQSPTCGCGKIYDGTFSGKLIDGDGIFCSLLKENNIEVYTEHELDLMADREPIMFFLRKKFNKEEEKRVKTTDENVLTAPCGLYCGECVAYRAKDDPALLESLVERGLPREKLPCPGCRLGKGNCPALGCDCETYVCAESRGVEFCHECAEFPCAKLNPAADRANALPHNIKIYNLCCIKHQGLAEWLRRAPEIHKRYFQGKMVIGKGPQIE